MSICCIIIFINALKRLWVRLRQDLKWFLHVLTDFCSNLSFSWSFSRARGILARTKKARKTWKSNVWRLVCTYIHLIFFSSHLIHIVGVKSRAFKHIYPENENWRKKLLEISFAYRTVNIFITSILDLCRIFRNSPQPPLATMTIAMSLGVDIACHVTAKYPSSAKYGRKVGSQVLLPRLPSQVMRKQNLGNTNRCPLTA